MLWSAKIFQFHLLEFARAKNVITRVDLVAKRLADLRDAERQFFARSVEHVFELLKNRLRRFRAEIGKRRFVFARAEMGAKHEVKRTRLGQIFAAAIRTLLNAVFIRQLIGPESGFAGATVHHRITERVFMAAGLERGA